MTLSTNVKATAAAIEAARKLVAESTSLVSYNSRNHVLVLGQDEQVKLAVSRLADVMSLTVLVDAKRDQLDIESLPGKGSSGYGRLSALSGHLGEYIAEVTVNDRSVNLASIHNPKRHAFDMVLDLSSKPWFSNSLLPFGYFAPKNESELEEALSAIPDMVGEFEKPKFFNYNPDICAHGNSGLQACHRCIDACPADAITSLKDRIEVDPFLCQGGGACATVCPSGAIQYVYPRLQDTLEKLRCMLKAYHEAGGEQAVIAFYGEQEAKYADSVMQSGYIPFLLEETASVGMDVWLSALAYGANQVILLTHDTAPAETCHAIDTQLTYAHAILEGMGFDSQCLQRKTIDSSTELVQAEVNDSLLPVTAATFMALDDKRSAIRMAVDHLYQFAAAPRDTVALPAGAPFGEVQVNKDKCTLCMACVSVCPAKALADGNELPKLVFSEANCVQCGLCSTACPEMALTLSSRYNYAPDLKREQRVLNEDEPFCCPSCGKPFATRNVIEMITGKLSSHHMFQSEEAINRLKLCDDCRVRDMFSRELETRH